MPSQEAVPSKSAEKQKNVRPSKEGEVEVFPGPNKSQVWSQKMFHSGQQKSIFGHTTQKTEKFLESKCRVRRKRPLNSSEVVFIAKERQLLFKLYIQKTKKILR